MKEKPYQNTKAETPMPYFDEEMVLLRMRYSTLSKSEKDLVSEVLPYKSLRNYLKNKKVSEDKLASLKRMIFF